MIVVSKVELWLLVIFGTLGLADMIVFADFLRKYLKRAKMIKELLKAQKGADDEADE